MELLIAAGLLMAALQTAQAHPHVFIDAHLDVQFSADGLSGIRVEWIFDTMFGSSLIADYDRNKNGRFDPQEIALIEKQAFSNLVNFNYFTYLINGDRRHDVRQVSDFKASIIGKTVLYAFFISFALTWDEIDTTLVIGFFDKTNYCDFKFVADKPFSVSAQPDIDISAKIVNTKDGWLRSRAFEELRIQYKRR